MNYLLPITFFIVSILSLLITFSSIKPKKTPMEIVNDMGIGYNLGNTFENYNVSGTINNPYSQITLYGNDYPTKKLFSKIKKYGFKTIRLPVTWLHFIDNNGNINPEWLILVKQVVNWVIKSKMYCILNVHHDGGENQWLREGLSIKDKYSNLWKQIANEFKNFNENLIFESMNDVEYSKDDKYDYITLVTLNQAFVDIVRNSGGKNGERLLLICGATKKIELTCSSEYKLPIDPSRKLAVSIRYDVPVHFTLEKDDNPWTYRDDNNVIQIIQPMTEWGNENDYKEMFNSFETLKEFYTNKGIPIIIVEVMVLTKQKKKPDSIRKYLFAEFTMSSSYNGMMSCLWDSSNTKFGEYNFYDRKNDKWYDEKIKDNFLKISKGKFIKPTNYYVYSNKETISTPNSEGKMKLFIGKKRVSKVIFNVYITAKCSYNVGFGLITNNKYGNSVQIQVNGDTGEKKYDGSYIFTIDVSNNDNNDFIQVEKWWGKEFIFFNYLTIEFSESYTFFDYNSYIKLNS